MLGQRGCFASWGRNMKNKFIAAITIVAGLGLSSAYAKECATPIEPDIPDTFQSVEEKDAIKQTVLDFISVSQDYLACLDTEERGLPDDATDDQKNDIVARYNSNVDAQQAIANRFNVVVKAFNAANGE